jgi:hypothetical protein
MSGQYELNEGRILGSSGRAVAEQWQPIWPLPLQPGAAILYNSLLQFRGAWLKVQWDAWDILFRKFRSDEIISFENPYVTWHVPDETPDSPSSCSPLIQNRILFPLGITLTELSLCRALGNLRTLADYDPVGVVSDLKTASCHLQYV